MNRFVRGLVFGSGFAAGVLLLLILALVLLLVLPVKLGSQHSIVGTDAVKISAYRLDSVDGDPVILGASFREKRRKRGPIYRGC